jgi:hypothetical protein
MSVFGREVGLRASREKFCTKKKVLFLSDILTNL